MAVWHYKFSIVPRVGIRRVHGKDMSSLEEYADGEVPKYIPDHVWPNYWEGLGNVLSNVLLRFEKILPKSPKNTKTYAMFGDNNGDKIDAWKDGDIDCYLDLRNFTAESLQEIICIAQEFDLQFISNENGDVLDPFLELIIDKIKKSKAYLFCHRPVDFVNKYVNGK
jgi:hypothetical protein